MLGLNFSRVLCSLLIWLVVPTHAAASGSDTYPDRPIKMVVPFSPSGGIDVLARLLGQELATAWEQPVVVENRPGASGNIGTDYAARSAPDGYTYLMTVNTIVMTPNFMQGVNFNPVTDFMPVTKVAIGYLALVTRPEFPASDARELIALAKAGPGKLTWGSPGLGTPHHLAMELLKQRADFDVLHVPYKGSAELVSAVLSGQIDCAFLPVHQALQLAKSGKLHILTAGGLARTMATPDIPSLSQATGIEDIDVDMWYALYLPANTAATIVQKANREVNRVLTKPDVVKRLTDLGLVPSGSTSVELAALTRNDFQRWAQVIQQAGIKSLQ